MEGMNVDGVLTRKWKCSTNKRHFKDREKDKIVYNLRYMRNEGFYFLAFAI
jgi:hypothetical protein